MIQIAEVIFHKESISASTYDWQISYEDPTNRSNLCDINVTHTADWLIE